MADELKDQLSRFHDRMYTPFDPKTGEGLARPDPTEAEIATTYYAPGREAQHKYGVVMHADHETPDDGMCRQARIHARALAAHVPLLLTSIGHRVRYGGVTVRAAGDDVLRPEVLKEVGELRHARLRHCVVSVFHTLIYNAQQLKALIVPQYVRSQIGAVERALKSVVVYTPWERSSVDPEVVRVLNKCGQVWLQCKRNRDVFVEAGVKESLIRLHPNAFERGTIADIPVWQKEVPRGRRYYNIGKWEPRKNQAGLIGAFLLAHRPADHALLTIKTTRFGKWKNYPTPEEALEFWMKLDAVKNKGWTPDTVARAIRIYDRYFTVDEMVRLHAMHNIYVAASHAEGWDYPAFDAKTADNRLVHVGFGGSEDYADADDVRLPWTLSPVHPDYGWEARARWAEYDETDLAEAMTRAVPKDSRELRADLEKEYSAHRAGLRMASNLKELVTVTHPQLVEEMFAEAL
ncbi:MAG: glycosyltransferase [Gammaproteobacteria bacterium]|nr:glycosyltransferase [Gammaproteobacteria bacterium]NIR82908.1 glycosyltransferase [Gammaproteobacteria bacterium]NIR90176.1 glycosyltransferase [Gammaproteobacteria bacterium]NIU03735.1 glycosyltransferase [Gammaproteobacteria bacterium]NIV51378.1 hypothetical protein [Gammaproteobacteria bacterium]